MKKTIQFYIPVIATCLIAGIFLFVSGTYGQATALSQSTLERTIVVNTLENELNSDGDCSLREAVEAANTNLPVDACDAGDAIITDTITFEVAGTITLTSQLVVTAGGPLEINGGKMITVSGNGLTRVWFVEYGVLTLKRLVVVNGYAENGAGLFNDGGIVTIDNCTLSGNIAEGGGGGGIYNTAGSLVVSNSTLSGNSAVMVEVDTGLGGAISNRSSLIVTNSTLSGNHSDGVGAAIYSFMHPAILSNSTISQNFAGLGGAISIFDFTMTISNSIVANYPAGNDCMGPIADGGHNISSDDTCSFNPANGSMPNTDPLLGPLQDNGGPTWTHALLLGSPAIDSGDDAQCPATDQRGVHRPLDGDKDGVAVCDIGSYELGHQSIYLLPLVIK